MAKSKIQKNDLLSQYKTAIEKSKVVYISEIKLGVNATTDLKKELDKSNAIYSVIKNTLFKKALKEVRGVDLALDGKSSAIFCFDDMVEPAKKMNDLQKEQKSNPKMVVLGSDVFDGSKIKEFATMPTYEQLIGKVMYILNSPAQGVATVLTNTNKKLLWALNAIAKTKSA